VHGSRYCSGKETTAPCPDEALRGPLGRQAETGKAARERLKPVTAGQELVPTYLLPLSTARLSTTCSMLRRPGHIPHSSRVYPPIPAAI
jgi:hypothetical protein